MTGPGAPDDAGAQDRYRMMLDQAISPALRGWGFTGSAGRYAFPSATHWALLGFQKSAFSDRSWIQFTVNVLAVERTVWAALRIEHPSYPSAPSAGTAYGDEVPIERIGVLAGGGQDRWWQIDQRCDLDGMVDEVLRDIRVAALPWLIARISGR